MLRRQGPAERDDPRTWVLGGVFAVGIAIAALMISRVQTDGDALDLLARGWLLAQKGVWAPLGNSTSGGGYVPGNLTALLVGLPLKVWMDYRAPVVFILICHVVAYLMLDRLLGQILGFRARMIFAVVYWLSPWRLYQSAWLDNTNYVFLTGAVHLWSCYRQRFSPSWIWSTLLVVSVGLSAQLHLNALVLVFSAVLLWLRGYWKPHWGGVALGTLVTFGTLIPFCLVALDHPEVIPISRDPMGLSLVRVSPVIKGMVYWFRYGSLYASWESLLVFDFSESVGTAADVVLSRIFLVAGRGLGTLTLIVPILAGAWLWKRRRAMRGRVPAEQVSGRAWLREYAVWNFVGCVLANAISPVGATMWWHNLIAFHAAVLPVVLWVDALLRTRRARVIRAAGVAYLALTVFLLLGMAWGGEQFMHGGERKLPPGTGAHHGIQADLGLEPFTADQWPRTGDYFYRAYLEPLEFYPPADTPARSNP